MCESKAKQMNLMPPTPVSRLQDADILADPAALMRAAQRARDIAAHTATPLIVTRNGELVGIVVTTDTTTPGTLAECLRP
jgi:high-affinity K+ transport system ATPase subunit B